MQTIPVLDLRGGRAVHARGGDRSRYATVQGVLGSGDDPLALARAFRDRLGCRELYIADLDAIVEGSDPTPLLGDFARLGMGLRVDAGVRTPEQAAALLAAGADRVVVGLETLAELGELERALDAAGPHRVTFGLDLRDGRALAASAALRAMDPLRIAEAADALGVLEMICLDLARVGSGTGPAAELIRILRGSLPRLRFIAGGGTRNARDLKVLAALGCSGALVGTALHQGRITRADIERVRGSVA